MGNSLYRTHRNRRRKRGRRKAEQLDGRAYRNLEELALALPTVIDVLYNQEHLHSALGYLTPAEFSEAWGNLSIRWKQGEVREPSPCRSSFG